MRKPDVIYLDHAATTPVDPRVREAMQPYWSVSYGNPSSVHQLGREARHAVENSRARVAACIGAEPSEIVFTSGGTEADNLAIFGSVVGDRGPVLSTPAEHEAVLRPVERLAKLGIDTTWCAVDSIARCRVDEVARLVEQSGATFATFMLVNNETGAVNDVPELARICRSAGAVVHCDAVQAGELLDIDVQALGVDMLSLSAHKMYGPKGIGCLYVRGGTRLDSQVVGGSQERRRRGGTEDVAAVVGFAKAIELARDERSDRHAHVSALTIRLQRGLEQALGDAVQFVTDLTQPTAPHILSLVVPPDGGRRVDGEMLILNLDVDNLLVSAGSACTAGTLEPSHVLTAAGWAKESAAAALRFSAGKDNTPEEIDRAVEIVGNVIRRMAQGKSKQDRSPEARPRAVARE